MIDIVPLFKRKRAITVAESSEKPRQPDTARTALFSSGACERIQDLLISHDGERVGFRKPVQG